MKLAAMTKKTPEVERCASKEASRPVLTHAYLEVTDAEDGSRSARLMACDSYKLVVVPVEPDAEDTTGFIPAEALKAQRKASTRYVAAEMKAANETVEVISPGSSQTFSRPFSDQETPPQFPNVDTLLQGDNLSGFKVALNPAFLLEVAKALGSPDNVTLEFVQQKDISESNESFAPNPLRPIRVTGPTSSEAWGLLMPIRRA